MIYIYACVCCEKPMSSPRARHHLVCDVCSQLHLHAKIKVELPLSRTHSVFWYSPEIRRLILRAKIQNHLGALQYILHLFSAELNSLRSSLSIEDLSVMPMPSSLWGRMHGRVDVSFFLASLAARTLKCSFLTPPWHLGWHLKKNAMKKNRQVQNEPSWEEQNIVQSPGKTIIVVDDIFTTGSSFRQLALLLHAKNVHLLSFARSK